MLTITLLGEQTIVDPSTGRTLTRSARSMALLGLLVARRGVPQSRASIAGWFWPDSVETQAMTNLRRELHQLRRLIDDDSLEVTGSHLCWHDRGRHKVDLGTFFAERDAALSAFAGDDAEGVVAHGTRALAAYAGDLLPGLDGEWLEALRDELRTACVQVCDAVSTAATQLRRVDVAINVLRQRIGLDPYDEPANQRLMTLLDDAGDRAGAVRVYHRLSGLLERDLGIEPDPRTTALLDRITVSTEPHAGRRRRREQGRVPLVGRGAELERLRRLWRGAASAHAAVALVVGAPGVGKSRLVEELAVEVRADHAVTAVGRCYESIGRLPLSPVADWLRSRGIATSLSRLAPAWRAEVERLVPTAGSPRPDPPDPADAWQQHRFVEGLARALAAPHRPTLLVLDNLQWCDADTLQVVMSLLATSPAAPVLVVALARPMTDDGDAPPSTWLADLRRGHLLTEVQVAPFDAATTIDLATRLAGKHAGSVDPTLLHEATGGFPLFVVEAVRAARGDSIAPDRDAWTNILSHRLDQLSADTHRTAALAAALHRDFTLTVLTEASDLDPDTVVRAVDELWRQRLVHETRDGYDFAHDLIRAAAYQATSPPMRWLLHRRLADALEKTHPDAREAIAPQVAEQYALAGDHEQAVGWYLAAADAVVGVFAFAEVLELMEHALREVENLPAGRARDERELECRIRQVRTMISLHGYAYAGVETTSLRIERLAGELGRIEDQQGALSVLFGCYFVRGRMDSALEMAQRTLRLVEGRDPDGVYSSALHAYGGAILHHGGCDAAYHAWAGADPDAMGETMASFHARTDVFTAAWWAHAAWACGRPEEASALATHAVEVARATGHVPSQVVALTYGALSAQLLGDRNNCAQRATDAVRLCDRYRMRYYGLYARVLQSWARGPDGADDLRRAVHALQEDGAYGRMPYWLALLAELSDDPAEVAGLLDEAVSVAESGHEHLWLPELWRRQAALAPHDATADDLLTRAHAMAVEHGNVPFADRIAADQTARSNRGGKMTSTAGPRGLVTLADELRGHLVRPSDAGYDAARSVYNAMIDRRPAAIAVCADANDVSACVVRAHDLDIDLCVRGGAHNAGGLGVWDDALVLDLGGVRDVRVDTETQRVRVGGGCTWEDVDAATYEHGFVVPSGINSTTGVGGLTLGGGIGYHSRLLGLTIDNLVSAHVVLADGRQVTASATEEPDLFWALRGGGGNFGVVTTFEFQGHPIGDGGNLVAGPVLYDLDRTPEVLGWYRERLPQLPRELNGWAATLTVPSAAPFPVELWGRHVVGFMWCYDGPHDRLDEALAPTYELGAPLLHGVGPMPFPALNSAFNGLYPRGLQWYWRADFFDEITDVAVAAHQTCGATPPSSLSTMHLYPIDGAVHDVGASETAFVYRDVTWAGVIVGVDADPALAPDLESWVKGYWTALHSSSAGGAYVNFLMDEGADRVRHSYRGNFERLQEVKRAYDPGNFFHVNQNIQPA